MKVFVVGNSPVRLEIESRLAMHGHTFCGFPQAEIAFDLCVDTSSKRVFLEYGDDPDDDQVLQFGPDVQPPSYATYYSLSHASSATSAAHIADGPGWVIGFSIIPPITDSSILEIARPLQTPVEELEKARSFFESLGFTVVEVPDGPGLIQARIVACLANEAFSALSEGVADAKTIDTAMKLGTNYPLGPLEWAELIGLESILAIMEGLQLEYGDDRYRPHPLLKRLVAAGMSVAQFEAWKLER